MGLFIMTVVAQSGFRDFLGALWGLSEGSEAHSAKNRTMKAQKAASSAPLCHRIPSGECICADVMHYYGIFIIIICILYKDSSKTVP